MTETERHNPDIWKWLLLLPLILILVSLSLYPVEDFDLGIVLRLGQEVVNTHHIPTADSWSYTAAGRPWIAHQWLGAAGFYLLFVLGGYNLIILFKILVLALSYSLLYLAGLRWTKSQVISYLLVMAAVFAGTIGFAERVQVLGFAFTAWALFEMIEYSEKGFNKRLLLLPFGFLVWANVHFSIFYGWTILGVFWAWELVRRLFWKKGARDGNDFKAFTAVCLASLALSFASPGLLKMLRLTIYDLAGMAGMDTIQYYTPSVIREYAPLWSPENLRIPVIRIYLVFSAAAAAAFLAAWMRTKKADVPGMVLFTLFFWLSISYVKAVPVSAVITAFLLMKNTGRLILKPEASRFHRMGRSSWFNAALLIFGLLAALSLSRNGNNLSGGRWWRPAWGLNSGALPEGAVDFMKQNGIKGSIFNNLRFGGFLIWNDIPVFIDGRLDLYDPDILGDYTKIDNGQAGFEGLLDKYGIDHVLADYPLQPGNAFYRHLYDSGLWALVYWDDASMLFLKRCPRFSGIIASEEYKYVNPDPLSGHYGGGGFWAAAEVQRRMLQAPVPAAAYEILGVLSLQEERIGEAVSFFSQGLKTAPYQSSLHNQIGWAWLYQGQSDSARHYFNNAVKYEYGQAGAYKGLGWIDEAERKYKGALKNYLTALEYAPEDLWLLNRAGLMFLQENKRESAIEVLQKGARLNPDSEAAKNLKLLLKK